MFIYANRWVYRFPDKGSINKTHNPIVTQYISSWKVYITLAYSHAYDRTEDDAPPIWGLGHVLIYICDYSWLIQIYSSYV